MDPKLQHRVPQFYLRSFANSKEQIGVYRRASRKTFLAPVAEAGAESGFYNVVTKAGEVSTAIETDVLARVDSDAASAFKELLSGTFPPSEECRAIVAGFLSFQLVRGREFRHQYQVNSDYMMKVMFQGMDRGMIVEALREESGEEPAPQEIDAIERMLQDSNSFHIVPHNNESIRLMLKLAEDFFPYVYGRRWMLLKSSAPLITTDEPVVKWARPQGFFGIGLMNADELRFPLGRYHMLAMLRPDIEIKEEVKEIPTWFTLDLNAYQAALSYEYIYYHPEDEDTLKSVLEKVDLPEKRPITSVSGGSSTLKQGDLYALPVKPQRVKKGKK